MKNLLILLALTLMSAYTASAQSKLKFGHINSAELLELMPERNQIQVELEEYAKQLETQLTTMTTEYQTKVADYQQNEASWTELIKNSKLSEISDLERRIQEFQSTAQQSLQQKEQQLVEPLINRAQDAIDKVAAANGYTYVFDTSTGAVVVFPDSDNLLGLVKKELGVE
ncbi:MAG TPA: hypothetical protein DDX92_10555 [Flavobacteriales bacterium]|jgi:outer membrane protein|nr:hypothetical protein [Flavobacteriales bacterium]